MRSFKKEFDECIDPLAMICNTWRAPIIYAFLKPAILYTTLLGK